MAKTRPSRDRSSEPAFAACYDQGYEARGNGGTIADCPHPMLSPKEWHWILGWRKAGIDARRRPRWELMTEEEEDETGFDIVED